MIVNGADPYYLQEVCILPQKKVRQLYLLFTPSFYPIMEKGCEMSIQMCKLLTHV